MGGGWWWVVSKPILVFSLKSRPSWTIYIFARKKGNCFVGGYPHPRPCLVKDNTITGGFLRRPPLFWSSKQILQGLLFKQSIIYSLKWGGGWMMGPRRLKLITDATSRVPKSRYPGSKSRHFQILAANHDIFGIKMLQK